MKAAAPSTGGGGRVTVQMRGVRPGAAGHGTEAAMIRMTDRRGGRRGLTARRHSTPNGAAKRPVGEFMDQDQNQADLPELLAESASQLATVGWQVLREKQAELALMEPGTDADRLRDDIARLHAALSAVSSLDFSSSGA